MATVPFQTCSSLNFQSLKKTAAASGPIACATGPTCGACGANGALWLSWPALFQISPSCCFPFNDVTSESSYTLLGCCREDFRRCSWVLIGICKVHWPDLLKKSYWAFCEPFFCHHHTSSLLTHHKAIHPRTSFVLHLQETLCHTFCSSVCWTSSNISGSAKYVITEKYLDISVIHWN